MYHAPALTQSKGRDESRPCIDHHQQAAAVAAAVLESQLGWEFNRPSVATFLVLTLLTLALLLTASLAGLRLLLTIALLLLRRLASRIFISVRHD